MKYLRTVPLALFFLVMVYFAVFNWRVFTVSVDINTGFGLVTVPLVAAVFLVGIIFLGLQTGLTYLIDMRRNQERTRTESEIGTLKKERDQEISALKATFYEGEAVQVKKNVESIAQLRSEMDKVKEWMQREGAVVETAEQPSSEGNAERE